MTGSKEASTPLEQNHKLSVESGELLPDPTMFRILVGGLHYLTITGPDIAFAVSVVSKFMQNKRIPRQHAVYRMNRYVKSWPFLSFSFVFFQKVLFGPSFSFLTECTQTTSQGKAQRQ